MSLYFTIISFVFFLVNALDPTAVRVIGLKHDRVGVQQHFNGELLFNDYLFL